MVGLTTLQNRVARLKLKNENPFERKVPWAEFHAMLFEAASNGEMAWDDANDLLFGVKHWYDNPDCWR